MPRFVTVADFHDITTSGFQGEVVSRSWEEMCFAGSHELVPAGCSPLLAQTWQSMPKTA